MKPKSLLPVIEKNLPLMALSIVGLVIIVIFISWYVGQEKYIYFWDYATYFGLYTDLGAKFLHTPLKALDSISVSVRKAEYNNSGVVALIPFYLVFGAGRLAYISAIAVTYAFPIIVFFPFLMKKIVVTNDDEKKKSPERLMFFASGIILFGFLPQFWIPVLLGYIDVAGVGAIFLILYLFFRKKLADQSWKQLVFLGFLLSFLIILRRWYAYWTIGFFAAVALTELLDFLRPEISFNKLKNSLVRILVIGASAMCSFLALSSQIARIMLKTDYRDIYSAYHGSKDIFESFEKLGAHFGSFFIILVVTGLIMMLVSKDLREKGIFLITLFAVTFILFTRAQDIDLHHYYWVISILIIFAAVPVLEFYRRFSLKWQRLTLIATLLCVSLANFSIVFFPAADSILQPIAFVLPKTRRYPKIRNDFEQLHQLLITLNSLTENSDKKIYVLSSSVNLNSSILQNGASYFEPELQIVKNKILQTNDVDKRDGFPFQLYRAEFIVIADPVGTHLSPADQKVVTIPAGQILEGREIGAAYAKLPIEFILDGGEKIFVYQKQRELTHTEMEKMSQLFVGYYPENHEKFEIDDEKYKQ